jgi:aspartate racemase
MKTIGLLGGTGWPSTIEYYTLLNKMVHARLGGNHSAKILLKSIDYHDLLSRYGKDPKELLPLLKVELMELIQLKPDCFMICCNTLHKYYDLLKHDLGLRVPMFHAVELTAKHSVEKQYKHVLLLATKFTMEDGFFAKILEQHGIQATIPSGPERQEMQTIHNDLMNNVVTEDAKQYFKNLITKHKHLDGVILGCTEWNLVVSPDSSALPIIDPVYLQSEAAVEYALGDSRLNPPAPQSP